jgi:hypothetical protein
MLAQKNDYHSTFQRQHVAVPHDFELSGLLTYYFIFAMRRPHIYILNLLSENHATSILIFPPIAALFDPSYS